VTGRQAEASEQSRKALAMNPKSPVLLASAALVQYLLGNLPAAERGFAAAREAGAADVHVLPWRARAQAAAGSVDAALDTTRQFDVATGGTPTWLTGYVHAIAGQRREAEAVLAAMVRQSAEVYVPALEMAYLSLALGQHERALELVETAVGEHSRGSEYLAVDPIVEPLRREPRFMAALRAMRLTGSP
jgi:tetratricopeptide (TPR) repeat protein